ncbi:MAG TPA: ATP-binding protein [Solirubrobacteraceae bacterium]|nr:ATP-binding protein [Solirubrobacteraceae bacterium]
MRVVSPSGAAQTVTEAPLAVADRSHLELDLAAVPSAIGAARHRTAAWLEGHGVAEEDVEDLKLMVSEAASNAVRHAYPDGPGSLIVTLELRDGEVWLQVADHGEWRPQEASRPGWGLCLLDQLSERLQVERAPGGTVVRATRRLSV